MGVDQLRKIPEPMFSVLRNMEVFEKMLRTAKGVEDSKSGSVLKGGVRS